MNLRVFVFLGAVLWMGAVVAMVVGLIGTRRPVGPPSVLESKLKSFWDGPGRTARQRRFHRATLVLAVVVGIAAAVFTSIPVIGVLVAIAIPGAPWVFNVGKAEHEAIVRIEAVGEWARRLKDVSVVGMGLQQAIVASASTAPADIAEEVRDLAARLQAGIDARVALLRFADDIADAVCDQIVAALTLHLTDRGDRLGDVLNSIANAAAAVVATRREVEAKRTQSRFAVRFLTVTSLLALAYGLVRPSYMHPYASVRGELVLIVLSVIYLGILMWVRSMSKPEQVMRFLNTTTDSRSALEVS